MMSNVNLSPAPDRENTHLFVFSAQTEARLLEHSKDDTYVITEDVKVCREILDKHNILVLFAKAGGGKSKASLQRAIIYQNELYTPMLFVNEDLSRNRDLINFNHTNIVIVEDFFGRSNINFNEDKHRGVLDILYSCTISESCKTKLILTIRGDEELNLELIKKHKIFDKEILINLDNIRSWHCHTLILSKHMKKHGIGLCECKQTDTSRNYFPPIVERQCRADVVEMNDSSLKVCVEFFYDVCCRKYEIQIGFPQACYLFCSKKCFTKQGMVYFTHTSQSLVDEMNHLKVEGFDKKQIQYQYCVLVYTAMKRSIDLDDIDEKCFLQILSSVYDESQKIKMPLVKAAIIALEGTYIRKKTPLPVKNVSKRPNVSDMYVLQHYTIQEAILASYGDDVDVLTFCDSSFLIEYIRPNGYTDPLSDNMVLLFTDYEILAKRLISVVSTDDKAWTSIGMYLQVVALLNRHDKLIQFFFQGIGNVKPEHYTCLINGLTDMAKNEDFVRFHPKLCSEIMVHSGLTVFLKFCRPIGWIEKNRNIIEIQKESLWKKLYSMIAFIEPYENGKESNETQTESECYLPFTFSEIVYSQNAVGNYVFENLIAKGFHDIVITLFTSLQQNAMKISPQYIKQFLDGLLDEGKRPSIVSQFKDFFEALLFRYGSIPIILQLCRPVTATISSPNLIQVDDKLLIAKLSAYLESSAGHKSVSKMLTPFESREDAYIVYWDEYYLEQKCICDIAKFIAEHGVYTNNDKFLRLMYEQLVSDKEEHSDGEESVHDDSESNSENNGDEDVEHSFRKCKKVVFDDYPGDEIRVNENGTFVFSKVSVGFIKKVYSETPLFKTTYSRLFKFLSQLTMPWFQSRSCTRMSILKSKFESLYYNTDPDQEVSDCDDSFDSDDYCYNISD